MVSLKQLAQYCRDYIDLISPSLLSRQAKQIIIPQEVLDATPLYKRDSEVDYESLVLSLNLEPKLDQLEVDEEVDESEKQDELSEEDRQKLEIARVLDDIYRKYETSSYTKQVSLRFGRISFRAQPINDTVDEEAGKNDGFKRVEQYLFSVPVTIAYRDSGGARHYSLIVEDSMVTTNVGFLSEFLPQEDRDELFKFIAQSEAEELTTLPVKPNYVDELWTKITHFLQQAGARDISNMPDMENVLVILLPKVNYFLSQDLLGIIDVADDEAMLDTSLSAWVDDRDMSINEQADDDGSRELFFPFPYDNSQLQVLGKLGNRAAVVEGPPGTGKSQTIANILCHLAATGQKVLFVSQKDQAVRGVKDKLKTLDIPYLFGYLPDRSSRLHSEEDERDSAANSLKGIAQALYSPSNSTDPKEALVKLHEYKPQFDTSIDSERKYFDLHSEWLELDAYDFGDDSLRITQDWHNQIKNLHIDIAKSQEIITTLEHEQKTLAGQKTKQDDLQKQALDKSVTITKQFADKTNYSWIAGERELLRGLSHADVTKMMHRLIDSFEANADDRKSNFIKSKLNNMRLSKELNASIEALPREMYESLHEIVFSDESKTKRFMKLKEIAAYFNAKDTLDKRASSCKQKAQEIEQKSTANMKQLNSVQTELKKQSKQLTDLQLSAEDMKRIEALTTQYGESAFESIARRYELKNQLDTFKVLNPNFINEEIIREKSAYKSLIRNYLKNRLALRVEDFRQTKKYRATLESIGRKLSKTKKAYKTFDSLKSNPDNFEAMSGIIPIWMMGLDDASRVLPLLQNIFDYVIIDEASQCNISYALPAMYRANHTILFGDTLQMRDTTTAFKSNERLNALAKKHKIPEDLQIKASEDSVKSVMDIAKLSGFQTTVLRNHYRSPIELIGFSNEWFYEPRGRRLQVVNDDILATDAGRVLTNHIVAPNPAVELSEKTNLTEAVYIRDTLLPEIKSDPRTADKSIAILTFFNEQAELLRRVITDDEIKIAVIEGIQGDERDIVIYSFVIKSPQDKLRYIALTGESGEIRKEINEGRVNVAFSRARLQVHTVTSIAPNLWPEGIWIKRYLEYVEERGRVNRLAKTEQHFDSKFEERVYDFLFSKLDPKKYTLTTQVESCGFKIDLVIRNIESGKRLAIECDGPTHFEAGDGQVRVANDYERQFVLETAGWRFYRITYSEWLDEGSKQKRELLDYIAKYMKQAKSVTEENIVTNEPEYVPLSVNIPEDFVKALKESAPTQNSGRFGRKPAKTSKVSPPEDKKPTPQPQIPHEPLHYVPLEGDIPEVYAEATNKKEAVPKKKSKQAARKATKSRTDFEQLAELELSARRSIVVSRKPDGSLWVNEKLSTDSYKGFTQKGFGIQADELSIFVEALNSAIKGSSFQRDFVISNSLKLVVHNPDDTTVDIRYYKTSDNYTGYLKKGIRLIKPNAEELKNSLQDIARK
jgi:very-short-patch-repair endonuclease